MGADGLGGDFFAESADLPAPWEAHGRRKVANRMGSSGLKGRGAGEWAGRISCKTAVVAGKFEAGAGEWGWRGMWDNETDLFGEVGRVRMGMWQGNG